MASVTKFTAGAVYNQLRHNLRQIAHSSNPDIDPVRLRQDYVLSPDRGMSLSLIHISEPTRRTPISYAVFCLKKKKKQIPRAYKPTRKARR